MASKDKCVFCGGRIGLSDEAMRHTSGAMAHRKCMPLKTKAMEPEEATRTPEIPGVGFGANRTQ